MWEVVFSQRRKDGATKLRRILSGFYFVRRNGFFRSTAWAHGTIGDEEVIIYLFHIHSWGSEYFLAVVVAKCWTRLAFLKLLFIVAILKLLFYSYLYSILILPHSWSTWYFEETIIIFLLILWCKYWFRLTFGCSKKFLLIPYYHSTIEEEEWIVTYVGVEDIRHNM